MQSPGKQDRDMLFNLKKSISLDCFCPTRCAKVAGEVHGCAQLSERDRKYGHKRQGVRKPHLVSNKCGNICHFRNTWRCVRQMFLDLVLRLLSLLSACVTRALPSAHRQMMVKHRKSASRLRNHLSGFPTERKPCLADTADMPLLQIFSDCMQGYARTLMYVLRRSCEVAASGLTKPNLGTSPFPWVNEGRDR